MPRTEKTVREILEELFDTASQEYPYWNYIDKAPQREIDQALASLQQVLVPEEMREVYPEDFKCGGCGECEACKHYQKYEEVETIRNQGFNDCRTEILKRFDNQPNGGGG